MTLESSQDYSAKVARIAAIALGGTEEFKAWRAEQFRSRVNQDSAWFTDKLHGAMGYRAAQPEI